MRVSGEKKKILEYTRWYIYPWQRAQRERPPHVYIFYDEPLNNS